ESTHHRGTCEARSATPPTCGSERPGTACESLRPSTWSSCPLPQTTPRPDTSEPSVPSSFSVSFRVGDVAFILIDNVFFVKLEFFGEGRFLIFVDLILDHFKRNPLGGSPAPGSEDGGAEAQRRNQIFQSRVLQKLVRNPVAEIDGPHKAVGVGL